MELSQKRRQLLAAMLEQEGLARTAPAGIPRRPPGATLPLSFAQQRLWFLHQLSPDNPFYNVASALPLGGMTNMAVLQECLNEVVRRHEALRTTFVVVGEEPVQVVAPSLTLSLPVIDLRSLAPARRQDEALRLATEEASKPFELTAGPLIRASVLRLGDFEYVLLLTLHHIICDGWSLGVIGRELGALSSAFLLRRPSPLPELPVQYPDFAVWQRTWLEGEVLARQLDYWKQRLAGLTPLQLRTDFPRPPVATYEGATHKFQLPASLSTALQALSRTEGVTLFMTLLAGFQALLHRYTGQESIVVGSPVAGRNRGELEGMIGFFVNTLVMHTGFEGDPTFRELLRRVHEVALGAYAHQDLPFERLVEELQPERDLSRNPLFQVTFQFFNTGTAQQASAPGTPALSVQKGTAIFDLACNLSQNADGLAGEIEYSTALFRPETIARLAGHYRTLLERIVANPNQNISRVPMLSAADRQLVLTDWNRTAVDYSCDRCVHQLVEEQARLRPQALAVADEERQLTFEELNRGANRLAHHLRALGLQPDGLAAVCLDRSCDMVLAFLAVLKAGGAYLPLDPCTPPERLRFMVEDSGAPVVVTKDEWAAAFEGEKVGVVNLERAAPEIAAQSGEDPTPVAQPGSLAYVIYTSGSTGRPKGVEIEHRALLHLIDWHRRTYEVTPADRATQMAAPSYDAAVWEIWPYLAAGASVHIVPGDLRADAAALIRWLAREAITLSFVPTPVAEAALQLLWPADLALRTLLTGGDELHRPPPPGLPFTVVNHYGPTEDTVVSTAGEVPPSIHSVMRPDIGRPIANTTAYVVDGHLQLCPIGVPGELCVGGAGLARGYRRRPELTAEKFVTHPWSDEPGARLYRTGDLARFLPDGRIEFLGRIDHQVKLRGFRVELGEIEVVLRQQPGVQEAVVALREGAGGDKRLVAYVLPKSEPRGTDAGEGSAGGDEQIEHWRKLYNDTYSRPPVEEDPTFNVIGWNSSYSREPIPREEMRRWVGHTLARIRALQPRRVLEIGCGTGLLLFALAPHCQAYVGMDFSPAALAYVREHLPTLGKDAARVELLQKTADDLDGLEPGFDLVILNSVVQYFPSIEYLVKVMEGALRLVQPGGALFLGDVRHLPTLEAFHLGVELQRLPATTPVGELRDAARKRLLHEQELVIDPAFFAGALQHFSQVGEVLIEPKRGHDLNELTKFRYDVTLKVGERPPAGVVAEAAWHDWQAEGWDMARLRRELTLAQPRALGWRHVPNARVTPDLRLIDQCAEAPPETTVGDLRARQQAEAATGLLPETFWELEHELPYHVQLNWPGGGNGDAFDLLLTRTDLNGATPRWSAGQSVPLKPWSAYANQPLLGLFNSRLVPRLRDFLQRQLPEHMVPTAFMILESLPLTAHGKIDRRALPEPDWARTRAATACVAPRTPEEQELAAIWSSLLGGIEIGVEDNFFSELGGHSLLATQVMSRVRDHFHVELPLRLLFENPTVAALAASIAAARPAAGGPAPAMAPLVTRAHAPEPRVDDLSEEEVEAMLRGLFPSEANS
ncbi:MAG TPA: amino acid adenylation domain-containing protein [Chthoniobacteraceae bacterium]|nr:amino acid adenylation domain-containing protein [Chthoniobacteraceae bacterium]